MKAIISNRIYMVVDDKLHRELSKSLTYEVPSHNPEIPIVIKNLSIINSNIQGGKKLISIPSGRTDLIPANYEIEDKRVLRPVNIPLLNNIEPRQSQKEFLEFCNDSCILNAKPGWGKTFAAIFAAVNLGQKTLIITHTVALRNQWEREIVKITGIKPGVIGSGKFNIGPDIVVANTQSLIKHLKTINKEFGAVFLDEMHHVASPTFTKIINSLFARYKIGLSGTLKRKDGKHVVFQDYFSSKKYVPRDENTLKPEIHVYAPKFRIPEGNMWSERVNRLVEDPDYQGFIIALADKYVKMGHQVLIVSDRVAFLKFCERISPNPSVCVTGLDDREKAHNLIRSGQARELWGSINMYCEGISLNSLSCIISACPINNDVRLEQLIARINREDPGKLPPVFVDVKFCDYTGINQFRTRSNFYRQDGYKVRFVENMP